MKTTFQLLVMSLATTGLLACGEDDPSPAESGDTIECGEGTTVSDDGQTCVTDLAPLDCADDKIYLEEFHRCARVSEDYCGGDSVLDEESGTCVADDPVECAENTAEQGGECQPVDQLECGEGTVLNQGLCAPEDGVCDSGTAGSPPEDNCRPEEGICGENTTFDVGDRVCIPISDVACGPGTEEAEGQCLPTSSMVDDLAADADLDVLGVDGPHAITLPDVGDRLIFKGNIDAPDEVDGEFIQHEDIFEFSGNAGQWLAINLYSQGAPEPGFSLSGADDFYRLSDLNQGFSTSRTVVLPADGTFELAVSNLPQLAGELGPAGGDSWGYVGYIETLDAPTPESIAILDESIDGDITDLTNNFYEFTGLGSVNELLLILDAVPGDADGELQIWSDTNTLDQIIPLEGESVSLTPPAQSFYVLFDYAHAFGADTFYAAQGAQGAPLADGQMISTDIPLSAGEYLGLSQFNTEGAALSAAITDGTEPLVATDALAISTDEQGQTSLYYLSDTAQTVTVELLNDSGSDIAALSASTTVGTADDITIESSGNRQDFIYDGGLLMGERHYFVADVQYDGLLAMSLPDASGDAQIMVFDDNDDLVFEGTNATGGDISPGNYTIAVQAQDTLGDGFTLRTEESTVVDISETTEHDPALDISFNGTESSTLTIGTCTQIDAISVTTVLDVQWTFEVDVLLISPSGESVSLRSGTSGSHNTTYPDETLPAESLDALLGTNGSGQWELEITNDAGTLQPGTATLDSWTLNLTCTN